MLISDFQNSIQGRYLIKNIEIGLFVFDIPNRVQTYYGLALSLEMTWPNPVWAISQEKSQTTHSRYRFCLFSTEPGPYFSWFLLCTNPSKTRSPLSPLPPCSTVHGSFHFINIAYIYIQHLSYQIFFLLNHFFLWNKETHFLVTYFCTRKDVTWMWAKMKFQVQIDSLWPIGTVALAPLAETNSHLYW